MATFEAQPQQQQQGQNQVQPVVVYPNPLTKQPGPQKPHHHANGSFGTVFIVLAVIVTISAVACFLGRLCNRRVLNRAQKPSKHSHGNNGDHGHNHSASSSRPKDQSRVHELARPKGTEGDMEFGAQGHKTNNSNSNNKDGDIEFGFESMRSSSAPNSNNNGSSSMRPGSRGHVALEKTGDHSKPHGGGGGGGGGGGKYYDYHGGPRASE